MGNQSPGLRKPGVVWIWEGADPASPSVPVLHGFFFLDSCESPLLSFAIKTHQGLWLPSPFDRPVTTTS